MQFAANIGDTCTDFMCWVQTYSCAYLHTVLLYYPDISPVKDCAAEIRLQFIIDGAVCSLFLSKAIIFAQFVTTS